MGRFPAQPHLSLLVAIGVGAALSVTACGNAEPRPARGGAGGAPPPPGSIAVNKAKCGNGMLDPGEQCDDGNDASGDGCSAICQTEDGWTCSVPGQRCVATGSCGNGNIETGEQCDDANSANGDGCSSSCTIEKGWVCRVPGKPCRPLCGDGVVELGKQCDDGNTKAGDGCSPTCTIEPEWSCTGSPSVCVRPVCGNGKVELGEACDCGDGSVAPPTGCSGPNGLFNGDGTGCSKTCTREPICRGTTGTGPTHACASTCGNGAVEAGEECDDGNTVAGDGCSKTCTIERGYSCTTKTNPDTQPCKQAANGGGQCLTLPVKYRDFKNESVAGGHPDFFYYGAPLASPVMVTSSSHGALLFDKRYCVPNSAGPARQNDSTARCWGIALPNLDNEGKPQNGGGANPTLCDCQFTDWSHDTNGGHVPGYAMTASPLNGLAYVGGPYGHPMYRGQAPVTQSAVSFSQWWRDGNYESDGQSPAKHAVATLELSQVAGSPNLYRFSSAPHTVWGGFFPFDPPANAFPTYSAIGSSAGPGMVRTAAAPWSEPLVCNDWPYWYAGSTSAPGFGAANGCKADQYLFAPSFGPTIMSDPAAWFAAHPAGDWILGAQGWFHDFWFSVEARYLFTFSGPFDLQFFGDDDTFIFINGLLVLDLGGVHQRLPGKVHVDASGNAQVQEGGNVYLPCTGASCPVIPAGHAIGDLVPCDGSANAVDPVTKVKLNSTCAAGVTDCDCRMRTVALGLEQGKTYEIAIFERDGHPTESNFQLSLTGFSTTQSVCQPRCGDGVVNGGEQCDCGDGTAATPPGCPGPNDDTTYGGCTRACTWGPYCGDGVVQSPSEDCDLGSGKNTATYGANGCAPGCKRPPYCGDGVVQAKEGEECDLGSNNGQPGHPCSSTCRTVVN